MHICAVEDDPQILDCIQTILEDFAGHTVGAYPDGASLLEVLLGASPGVRADLVITDLALPGPLSGEDIIECLWKDSRYAQLPVVVVTAATEQRIARLMARFQGLSIVRKPFHIDDLIRALPKPGAPIGCASGAASD